MGLVKRMGVVGVVGFAAVLGFAYSVPHWYAPKQEAEVNIHDPELIKKGEYAAIAGDCVACHTAPGGKPFAGGLAMHTPLGAIYSTNITPDPETGIGNYSYADFERAVRRGIRPDNVSMYPAMPSPSYQIVSDDEIKAMYAYFMSSVEAVRQDNHASSIPWPFNMRWPLALWQVMFAQPREFVVDPAATPEVQRGAYLVEGLAHCGACHTPRGIAFQEKSLHAKDGDHFLGGAVLEGWYAKSLRGEGTGLATWTEDELYDFLRSGRTEKTAAFGSMADVVSHSLQHMTDADVHSIAKYIKQLPAKKGYAVERQQQADTTTGALLDGDYSAKGALVYVEHCAACHRLDGKGAPRIFPALAGNSIVFAEDPSSLIQVTLEGGYMPATRHDVMTFAMPGFEHLTDTEVADVLTFIRQGWTNQASAIDVKDVARMRKLVVNKPAHYVPEGYLAEGYVADNDRSAESAGDQHE